MTITISSDDALEGWPFARGERGQQRRVVVRVDEVEERGDGLLSFFFF